MNQNDSGFVSEGIIFVRDTSGTYLARWQGKRASCTCGPEAAARAVARKVLGDREHVLEKLPGKPLAFEVFMPCLPALLTCPLCGQHNFTPRGLKAHQGNKTCQDRQKKGATL